jgi:hypothetical protein
MLGVFFDAVLKRVGGRQQRGVRRQRQRHLRLRRP